MSTDDIEHPDDYDPGQVATERWVRHAIAQQEEHLKRVRSCSGQKLRSHSWRAFGRPGAPGWEACVVCGVTRTDGDYRTMLRARRPRTGPIQ